MIPSRQRTLVLGLILIGVIFVGFFGLRFFRAFREFRGHRPPPFPPADSQPVETDVELIRDWMTIGFISHTYRTPPNLLYKALDIPPRGNEDKSLQQLNDEYFPNQPGYVLETVKGTILASQPIPTALPPAIPPSTSIPPAAP
jgi:hypothetical protein